MLTAPLLAIGLPVLFLSLLGLVIGTIWAQTTCEGTVRGRLLRRFEIGYAVWGALALGLCLFVVLTVPWRDLLLSLDSDREAAIPEIGLLAADFEFQAVGESPKHLSDLRGRPVVLNFFATWCGPCMRELPELDREIAQTYRAQGLIVLAVGVGETDRTLARFQCEKNYSFLIAPDPDKAISSKYVAGGIPLTYLIKSDGTVALKILGYSPKKLESLKSLVARELESNGNSTSANSADASAETP